MEEATKKTVMVKFLQNLLKAVEDEHTVVETVNVTVTKTTDMFATGESNRSVVTITYLS